MTWVVVQVDLGGHVVVDLGGHIDHLDKHVEAGVDNCYLASQPPVGVPPY